ncbi:MAG TPA: aminotransferase class III-fold pyridoxal phosphate-dependent enzyme [Candidatus Eisenbacteria bacterium]|nr:aminotransferase class III-fold pyridoxal phosphate-dependent enzyme [Candidatus Eisenbacteria bacterium]
MSRRPALRGDELPAMAVPPPGPKSAAAAKRLRRAEGAAIWGDAPLPIVWDRAKGSVVVDLDGNRYIDLTSGFGAASLGHAAPEIARAVAAQARRLAQGLGDLQPHAARERLVRRLSEKGGALSSVLLATTGSEAVDLALKTAALATGRRRFVAFEGSYHGQLGAALEATHFPASPPLVMAGDAPRAIHIPFPDPYRCPLKRACGGCDLACFDEGWRVVEAACDGPDPPGAVLVEPIQGRAGVIVPPASFLPRLAARARARGLVVIHDEILTGAGRTGPWWAWERSGPEAEPDLIAAGKGLGGGVAIAALFGRKRLMDVWAGHRAPSGESPYASTYYAHPLACAGALASLSLLESTAGSAADAAASFEAALRPIRELPIVGDVRQAGLLLAVDIVSDRDTRAADPARAASVIDDLMRRGVLAIPGGRGGNIVSFYPSRRIARAQIEFAAAALEASLRAVATRGA